MVTDESRKLADQSQRSAEKINVLASEIQRAINSMVMVTDAGIFIPQDERSVEISVHNLGLTQQLYM